MDQSWKTKLKLLFFWPVGGGGALFVNFEYHYFSHATQKIKEKKDILRVYLDTAYFAKTKNLLLKVLYIKVKVS